MMRIQGRVGTKEGMVRIVGDVRSVKGCMVRKQGLVGVKGGYGEN